VCHDSSALPPIDAGSAVGVKTTRPVLVSADDARFEGFLALPRERSGLGVLVLPDNRGLSTFYETLAIGLAIHHHAALAIDWFGRSDESPPHERGESFDPMPHLLQLSREGIEADMQAAIAHLRSPAGGSCEAVVALGFCFGGRYAFLSSAQRFGLAGAIGFYGMPGIAGPYGPGPTQHAADLSAPILGLFGETDEGITAEQVTAFDDALEQASVPHEIVTYPGAPHGFFDTAVKHAHPDACDDAWRRVLAFLAARRTRPDV
jgi:carboxymethylenebutenolidase